MDKKKLSRINTKFLLFVIATCLMATAAKSQTYVTGGIYSNTTWSIGGSPYIISDTVVVFFGVTLTIEPGVVVKFNDSALIDERGNLYANGTANDSIIFTSNSNSPFAGIYQGVKYSSDTVSFNYCRFSYATAAINVTAGITYGLPISHCLFSSNINGILQWALVGNSPHIDSCIFEYDTSGVNQASHYDTVMGCKFIQNGVGLSSSGIVINSIFIGNNTGIQDDGVLIESCTLNTNSTGIYGADDSITNCNIQYNNIGIQSEGNYIVFNNISNNLVGIETYYDNVISCNTICGNTHYNIIAEMPANESVSNNYWCLTDSAQIQATIYDAYQDFNLGFVYFTPFDTAACTHICNLSVIATATQTVVCAGDTTTLSANVTGANNSYTELWKPGNYSGLNYTVSPLATTTYTVVVTDSSGCKDSAFITIDTSCIISPPNCNLSLFAYATRNFVCKGDSSTLKVVATDSNPITSVIWQPGNYSGFNYIVYPDSNMSYTVTVTDNKGCSQLQVVWIDTTNCQPPSPCGSLSPPNICYVTTDTSATFNTVVWQKTGMDTMAIDSVVIYRQNIVDQFIRIGAVSVHAPTEYNDYGAQPLVSPSFYALGIIDTCGIDTNLSYTNETIFLQSSVGVGSGQANLMWNFYQGNQVLYYRILRDDSGTGNWHAIDSVQGSINAFTDRDAPINPMLRYMISTDWNVSCSPFMLLAHHAGQYVFNNRESYSNVSYLGVKNIIDGYGQNTVGIYPNPTSGALNISFSQPFEGSVIITDVLGQVVYNNPQFSSSGNGAVLNMEGYRSGMYIITFQSGDFLARKKIIKD